MDPLRDIQITNGWMPQINRASTYDPWYAFTLSDSVNEECRIGIMHARIDHPEIHDDPTRPPRNVTFVQVPPFVTTTGDNSWPVPMLCAFEIRTDTFSVRGGDSIQVLRAIDTIDVTRIRSLLASPSDYVMLRMRLLRHRDSSYVRTLDSIIITPTAIRLPGSTPGIDVNYATLKLPPLAPLDTVFIAVDMQRGSSNQLIRGVIQMLTEGESIVSYKRSTESGHGGYRQTFTLSVQPNPFNSMTLVTVKTIEGMPTVIELSDALGRKLQTLHDGLAGAGDLHLVMEGEALPAGTYFIRVLSGGEVLTRKIQLVK